MAVQRVPILPPPGLNTDASSYEAPGVWRSGSNVRFHHGRPQTLGGATALDSASAERYSDTRKLAVVANSSGTPYVIVAGQDTLYSVLSTDWTRTNIEPAAGWTGALRASIAMFGNTLLAVEGRANSSGSANSTLFEGASPIAVMTAVATAPANIGAMFVTPSRQVMALGVNEEASGTYNPRCIRWSDIEDYTDWTSLSSNNAGEYILPGQENIVGGGMFGDYVVIFTEGSLWLGQFIGQPDQTFVFQRVGKVGLAAQDAWVEFDGMLYWMSKDFRFFSWAVGTIPREIPCPIQREIWSEISYADSNIRHYHAFANRRFGEIWFCYGTTTQSPTKVAAYSVSESVQKPVWWKGDIEIGAAIDSPLLDEGVNAELLDTSLLVISQDSNSPLQAYDQQDGGTPPAANIQTSDFYLDEGLRRVQIQRYINDAVVTSSGYQLKVEVRDYPESTALATANMTVTNSQKREDFRKSGRLVSAKWSIGALAGLFFRLNKPAFDVVVMGER